MNRTGDFLHQIRRATTRADVFVLCREFLACYAIASAKARSRRADAARALRDRFEPCGRNGRRDAPRSKSKTRSSKQGPNARSRSLSEFDEENSKRASLLLIPPCRAGLSRRSRGEDGSLGVGGSFEDLNLFRISTVGLPHHRSLRSFQVTAAFPSGFIVAVI